MKKILISAIAIAITAFGAVWVGQKDPKGTPKYGGKPRAPVTVESDLAKTADPGELIQFSITLTPEQECEVLRTRIRGLNGVEIREGHEIVTPCSGTEAKTRAAFVRVAAGVSGSVVVDFEIESGGEKQGGSRSFALLAKGARAVRKSPGQLQTNQDGNPVRVFEAEMR